MNQNTTRKGAREKKPSRYLYFDETNSATLPTQKFSDHKITHQAIRERLTSTQETSQIAKLFSKFLNATNIRYKDLTVAKQNQLLLDLPDLSIEVDLSGLIDNKKNEGHYNHNGANDTKCRGSREFGQLVNKEQKGATKESKARVSNKGKTANNIVASTLETDLNLNHSINKNLNTIYINIHTLPKDILRYLAISSETLQNQNGWKSQPKEEKKVNSPTKDDKKIFKRQSYHLAIAYHMQIQDIRKTPGKPLDPTQTARMFRQLYQKPSKRG